MTTISASESASRRDGDPAEAQAEARGYSGEAASPSAAVRNIVLVGPAGAGKTSVLEALMFEAGALKRLGTIEHGDTVGDHDSISRDLGHSIDSTLSHLEAHGVHLNLIDTPGSMDFIGKSIAALSASDLVVIVVDTRTMHDPVLRRIARIAEDHNLPRMVVINKIDQGRDQRPLLANLGELFGPALRPIDLPNDHGHAVVDCFEGASGASDLGNVSSFHQRIIDQVVEVDDALMERYLSEGVLPPISSRWRRAQQRETRDPSSFQQVEANHGARHAIQHFHLSRTPGKLQPIHMSDDSPPFAFIKARFNETR